MFHSTHPWIVAASLGFSGVAAAQPSPEPEPAEPEPAAAEPTVAEPAAEPAPKKKKKKKGNASAAGSGEVKLGGDSDSSASGETSVRYTERAQSEQEREDKWIYRWAPQRNMAEIGVYGGVWFPSRHLELYAPPGPIQLLRVVAPEVGARVGYYPFRFFGVEVEGGAMPTRTLDTDGRATAWTVRGHLVGQIGLWSITPFLLAGTGILGMASEQAPVALGSEQDVAIHFGGGVKFFINRWVMLRLDIRNVVSNRIGVGQGVTSSPEILLGLSVTLGRKMEKKKERPRAGDRDGDRVLDRDDYCPDVFGSPPRGCPQVCIDDRDADGLMDPVDKCPDEPESRNGFKDGDGCPDEVPPELADLSGVMEGIKFDTDKDTIKPGSKPIIDEAVEVMKKFPTLRVRIIGHTDAVGPYRHNIDLSQRRSKSVRRYMVSKGIRKDRIETDGVGPDQPIDTNDTVEGRTNNRRIEFVIIEEDPAGQVSADGG